MHNLLIIGFTIPYPLDDGGKIATFCITDYLRHHYNITILFKVYNENDLSNIYGLRKKWPNVKIEYVSFIMDRKQSMVVQLLKKMIFFTKKYFVKSSIGHLGSVKIWPLNFVFLEKEYVEKIYNIVSCNPFDIVQVDYTVNLSVINILPDNVKKIFVEHESRYLIFSDELNMDYSNIYLKYLMNNSLSIERNFMLKYDAIVALSYADKSRLEKILPNKKVLSSGFGLMDEMFVPFHVIENYRPEKLIFIGSEYHRPNRDAVKWFIDVVLPEINKLRSDIKLFITGTWSEDFRKRYSKANVHFLGYVDDISAHLENSILVVPIRIGGGGVRAKVLESMASGVPVISTNLGAYGIEVENGKNIILANTVDEFVSETVTLFGNRSKFLSIAINGRKFVEANFSQTFVGERRKAILDQLMTDE